MKYQVVSEGFSECSPELLSTLSERSFAFGFALLAVLATLLRQGGLTVSGAERMLFLL
jgi:hypothetical protein